MSPGARSRLAETVHVHVETGMGTQGSHQVLDMHPGAAVDLGGELSGQDPDSHG